MPEPHGVVAKLEADGLIRRENGELRTTRRWQSAMARAALLLYQAGDDGADLRVPVALALLELYPDDADDDAIAARVAALVAIEAAELDPRARLERARAGRAPEG